MFDRFAWITQVDSAIAKGRRLRRISLPAGDGAGSEAAEELWGRRPPKIAGVLPERSPRLCSTTKVRRSRISAMIVDKGNHSQLRKTASPSMLPSVGRLRKPAQDVSHIIIEFA